jgi:RNA recognition motif-containing protein
MADTDPRKLFVAGLSDGATEVGLRQLFEAAGGNVLDVAVPRDRQTGRGRGFGFVTLASESQANELRDQLDGALLDGRSISVRAFRGAAERGAPERGPGGFSRPPLRPSHRPEGGNPDAGDERERTLFIANLPLDCTEREVSQLIESAGAGPIEKLHLPMDPNGRRRGFGFVTLRDVAAARNAITALRSATIRDKAVTVDAARPKTDRNDRPPPGGGPGGGPGDRSSWRPRPSLPPRRDSFEPAPRGFMEASSPPPIERQTWDERRGGPTKRGAKKEPKKQNKVRAADRGHNRRESEGLRAPRARELLDDWEDEETGLKAGGDRREASDQDSDHDES